MGMEPESFYLIFRQPCVRMKEEEVSSLRAVHQNPKNWDGRGSPHILKALLKAPKPREATGHGHAQRAEPAPLVFSVLAGLWGGERGRRRWRSWVGLVLT